MIESYTELSEEMAGWIADAARRFNVTRSEIIQRAVEHYLGHVEEARVAFEQRQQHRDPVVVDWDRAKKTLQKAHCRFDECPFADDCPADVCPL